MVGNKFIVGKRYKLEYMGETYIFIVTANDKYDRDIEIDMIYNTSGFNYTHFNNSCPFYRDSVLYDENLI